ncbi:hydroxyproline-rich glycoprotein family protein [Euphorbia peplus]|nr:hydroxyproline-rich glycoprotein family protein [Euphorbia peplus]
MITGDRDNQRKRKSTNAASDDLHLNKISHADDSDFLSLKLSYNTHETPNFHHPCPLLVPPEAEFIPQNLQSETLIPSPTLFRPLPVAGNIITTPNLNPNPNPNPPPLVSPVDSQPARRDYTNRRPRSNGRKITPPTDKTLTPPFPWATNKRATVHSLEELTARKIEKITGLVQCKRCEKQYEMWFNLREKFMEVGSYIANNKEAMHDRAPSVWISPVLPTCKFCEQENSVKPVISEKKKSINWLFLLLGQMLGCCTLDQLKYFCKHTENHRTGAKDRVLYLTYLGLCKQLQPHGPFDR